MGGDLAHAGGRKEAEKLYLHSLAQSMRKAGYRHFALIEDEELSSGYIDHLTQAYQNPVRAYLSFQDDNKRCGYST